MRPVRSTLDCVIIVLRVRCQIAKALSFNPVSLASPRFRSGTFASQFCDDLQVVFAAVIIVSKELMRGLMTGNLMWESVNASSSLAFCFNDGNPGLVWGGWWVRYGVRARHRIHPSRCCCSIDRDRTARTGATKFPDCAPRLHPAPKRSS